MPETNPKLLLIDDDRKTVTGVRNLLARRFTGEIRVAHDGAEGVRLAREFKPDLVLLDLDMPVIDGFEVLEQLKRHEVETRVIIVSGYGDVPTIVRCIRAGACDYLVKAVVIEKFVEHIKRSLALETAYNLRIAQAPAIIQQLLDRAENFEIAAQVDETEKRKYAQQIEADKRKHAKEEAMEKRRQTLVDGLLKAVIGVLYVAVSLGAVWAIHAIGIILSEGAVLVFFLMLVFLLLLPIGHLRDAAMSWFGAKARVKLDSSEKNEE